jgi:hypothetical protein
MNLRIHARLALLLAGGFAAGSAHAAASELARGVLVDPAAARAYVADATGVLQARALPGGRVDWRTTEPADPLLDLGDRVLALGRIDTKGVGLLLLLDAADGRVLDRIAFDLPEHVSAVRAPQPDATFETVAERTAQGARIVWRHRHTPLRGAYVPGEREPRYSEGALDVLLTPQRNFAVPLDRMPAVPAAPSAELLAAERLAGLEGRQFRSADDAAVMGSEARPDPVFGAAWHLTLRARASGRAAGSLVLPYSYVPFALLDDVALYRIEPTYWRDARGDAQGHPAQLVAFDLARNRQLWAVELQPLQFIGPVPP